MEPAYFQKLKVHGGYVQAYLKLSTLKAGVTNGPGPPIARRLSLTFRSTA